LSGLTAGSAGAVFSWSTSAVYPSIVFDLIFSLQMLAMIIIGGMGTSIGPLLGAAIVYLLYFYFLTIFPGAQLIVIGLLVTIIALFLPAGIVGSLRKRFDRLRTVLE
jgi:branched-chain amino acid transport system permease protein